MEYFKVGAVGWLLFIYLFIFQIGCACDLFFLFLFCFRFENRIFNTWGGGLPCSNVRHSYLPPKMKLKIKQYAFTLWIRYCFMTGSKFYNSQCLLGDDSRTKFCTSLRRKKFSCVTFPSPITRPLPIPLVLCLR